MTVTFCGHAQVTQTDDVRRWIIKTVEPLILDGADTFYFGGYGAFDSLAAAVMRELKKTYPHIRLVLVLAYLNRNVNAADYDYTLYPELEEVPPRFAISRRNERMVEISDAVVAYVTHDWGGAFKAFEYARRKRKAVFCFTKRSDDQNQPVQS